jgi:hypothetical protein
VSVLHEIKIPKFVQNMAFKTKKLLKIVARKTVELTGNKWKVQQDPTI